MNILKLWVLMGGLGVWVVQAQVSIVSVTPETGASNVRPTSAVVFRFSGPMDLTKTALLFVGPGGSIPVRLEWSEGNTVLTCTPSTKFPNSAFVQWVFVSGAGANGEVFAGGAGAFNTGVGSGPGGGTGTNSITSFNIGHVIGHRQTSATTVVEDQFPYRFISSVSLASNVTVNSIELELPTGVVLPLAPSENQPEEFFPFVDEPDNLPEFNAAFPEGTYTFLIDSDDLPSTVSMAVTSSGNQPGAARLTNFEEAQTINTMQPFTLRWEYMGEVSASDYVQVIIGNSFRTPTPTEPGALNGTARSVVIPAGTIPPNLPTFAIILVFRPQVETSGTIMTFQYRGRVTAAPVKAVLGPQPAQVMFTGIEFSESGLVLTLEATPGRSVRVEYASSPAAEVWLPLVTTSSLGPVIEVVDPQALVDQTRYYRAWMD